MQTFHSPGGRGRARRVLTMLCAGLLGAAAVATAGVPETTISVREERGVYFVDAQFAVAQPPPGAMAVLTDYESVPRFMPGVRRSVLRARTSDGVVLEQEATSRFMMFSRRVHLVLDVHEEPDAIRFTDRCGRSFTRYEGRWQVQQHEQGSVIRYQLTADPSFEVPDFLLKRLLKRDAYDMVERLRAEIAARESR